jgi:hypothetical protein
MIANICGVVVVTTLFVWMVNDIRKSKLAMKALFRDCHAGEVLFEWRYSNPDYHPGDFPYARWLVERRLKMYEVFLATHPYISRDEELIKQLRSFLRPSKPPPRKRRGTPRTPHQTYAIAA